MSVTSHQLAKELLSMPDKPVAISIDVSTCDADYTNMAFGSEYFGVNGKTSETVILLFGGKTNFKIGLTGQKRQISLNRQNS
jgi:hypothetical protein